MKRGISLFLALALAAALALPAGAAEDRSFSDVEGHWATGFIGALVKAGCINGYEDETFRPDRAVSRAEFAALLNRVAGRENIDHNVLEYVDVLFDFWAYDDIHNACL